MVEAPTKKIKTVTTCLSSPLGLVAHCVSLPDSNTATSWRSQWDISSATLEPWLGSAANWETAGKRLQWGEDSYYRTSVRNSTWSFTWAATGDLTYTCTVAPESGIMPGTQWPTATHWSTPWPSTNHACNKSWPGWRAAVSAEDVAWRHLEVNWWWHGDKRQQPVGHLVRQHHTQLLMHRSPSPPSSLSKFAAILRSASANQELVRNGRRWPLIYST